MEDNKRFLQLNDIKSYKIAFNLSNYVWDIVIKWDWFAKKHVGGQFVEAVDSVSANISEGFGRYHKKDKIKFYRYSQGSVNQAVRSGARLMPDDWNEKSKVRKLLKVEEYQHIFIELKKLPKELNQLIS